MIKVLMARFVDDGTQTEVVGMLNEVSNDTIKNLLKLSDFDYSDEDVSNLVNDSNTYTEDDVELYLEDLKESSNV